MRHPFISFVSVVCALLSSQGPEFTQQYSQRLAGALDEMGTIVRNFDEDSMRSGYDRAGALRVMSGNSERLVRDQATRMEENIARFHRLQEQQEMMKDAGPFERMRAILARWDTPLVRKTFDSYVWAVPLSFGGLAFAVIGFFVPYLLLLVASIPLRRRGWSYG
jgi:hypothetical protein